MLVAIDAQRLERPVKWIEDSREPHGVIHGHEQRYETSAAFDEEGRLLALERHPVRRGRLLVLPVHVRGRAAHGATEMPGPYRLSVTVAGARVARTRLPWRRTRGVEATIHLRDGASDAEAAKRLGMDAVEIRRQFDLRRPSSRMRVLRCRLRSGSYIESLEECAGALDFPAWKERQERRGARGA